MTPEESRDAARKEARAIADEVLARVEGLLDAARGLPASLAMQIMLLRSAALGIHGVDTWEGA